MPLQRFQKRSLRADIPLWMILGAIAILLGVVVTMAFRNFDREKTYMSRILSEKGAALIKAFEAGARTGMMRARWGGDHVQTLLEQLADPADILYMAVVDGSGIVLAHSDRAMIGKPLGDEALMARLNPGPAEQWRLNNPNNDRRVFEVYRFFLPLTYADHTLRRGVPPELRNLPRGRGRGWGADWCFPPEKGEKEKMVLVGLDVAPFEEARNEDIRNTMVISSVLLLLGVGGFFSLFWSHHYRVTRRKLQDTSAFADEVVTHLPVGLIATDRNGKIAFFNEAAERISGVDFRQARGKDPDSVLPPHLCGLKGLLDSGQAILEREMECIFSGAEPVPVSVSATRIVNEEGHFVGNVLILRDLGEVRRLQEEIRRKEKLAALGSLAAGVAHEIRNPLSSIKGLATYFRGKFLEGSEDREAAGVMIREVDRLNRVITELLEFAKPSELNSRPVSIGEVLAHSVRLIQEDAKSRNVRIALSEKNGNPMAYLDPDRFSQCLLNLFLNAIQAMDSGGVLSVECSGSGNGKVKIDVADTGSGIRPEHLPTLFDPYFTTKPDGTGLGLAIVHKIVEAHGGSIGVESTVGKGTRFTILLPGMEARISNIE